MICKFEAAPRTPGAEYTVCDGGGDQVLSGRRERRGLKTRGTTVVIRRVVVDCRPPRRTSPTIVSDNRGTLPSQRQGGRRSARPSSRPHQTQCLQPPAFGCVHRMRVMQDAGSRRVSGCTVCARGGAYGSFPGPAPIIHTVISPRPARRSRRRMRRRTLAVPSLLRKKKLNGRRVCVWVIMLCGG